MYDNFSIQFVDVSHKNYAIRNILHTLIVIRYYMVAS